MTAGVFGFTLALESVPRDEMPTILGHMAFASVAAAALPAKMLSRRVIGLGLVLSVLPDVDAITFTLGIPYGHPLGHRGVSHSILFGLLSACCSWWLWRKFLGDRGTDGAALAFLVTCAVSHGLLDAMTDGGRGVALLSPWSAERLFFAWRPIPVSPIGLRSFISAGGASVLLGEALLIGLLLAPALVVRLVSTKVLNLTRSPGGVPGG